MRNCKNNSIPEYHCMHYSTRQQILLARNKLTPCNEYFNQWVYMAQIGSVKVQNIDFGTVAVAPFEDLIRLSDV